MAHLQKRVGKRGRLYYPQLDGLRFFAYFFVLLSHYPDPATYFVDWPGVRTVLVKFHEFGWIGVDLFLVLSSFLIFSLLIEERTRTETVAIRSFYIRRALRIWPLYFPFLILAFLALPFLLAHYPHQASYGETVRQQLFPFLTFTGNFSYAIFYASVSPLFGHLWTVCLEEQFYIWPPLLVFFFAPRLSRRIMALAAGLLVLSAFWRWYVVSNGIAYPMVWVNPLGRLDPFVLGALAAVLVVERAHWFRSAALGYLLLAAAALLAGMVACFPNINASEHAVWQLFLVDLSATCLVLATFPLRGFTKFLSRRPLPFLGKTSYGLYVFHTASVGLVLYLHLDRQFGTTPFSYCFGLAVVLAVNIFVASISYRLYEAPLLKFKARFEVIHSRPA
jgi:peptidoglycan/LPS O-acetylase OafA/YrhL